jgi:YegS/Rv2252/BmrU family lipid kinase
VLWAGGPDLRRGGDDLTDGSGVFVIFNPAADGGRGEKRIGTYLNLLNRFLPGFRHAVSPESGGEAALAEGAIREGYHTVVAAGGDGTWSAVADRILGLGIQDATLGVLPSGTGNDFGRNLGVPGDDPEEAVRILARREVVRVDVGRLRGASRHEERDTDHRNERYFLNVAGFGFDVAVVDESRGARFLRGDLLYKTAALKQLFRFPGFSVTLEGGTDGYRMSRTALMLTITNGRFFGGGFPIAPGGSLTDGALHACYVEDARPLRRLRLFDAAGKGRHEGFPEVHARAEPAFRLGFPGPVRFELDGDIYSSAEGALSVEVCPSALRVLTPRPRG